MSAGGALLELARRHGIEPGYHDIWGHWHPLAEGTARALLAAMGVDASDDGAVDEALARSEHSGWDTLLPPVVVAREGDAAQVVLCLPAARDGDALAWTLELEDGARRDGEARADALPVTDVRDLGHGAGLVRRRALALPADLPLGYHRLEVRTGGPCATATLIRAPRACQPPPGADHRGRPFGIALQLYGLRSAHNWGIGDFGDLETAIEALAPLGVDMVGINPLHALFPAMPTQASPYSPSSRRYINPAYLHVESMDDFAECEAARAEVAAEGFQRALAALRDAELVDYERAVPLKLGVLRRLYEHFRDRHLATGSGRARAFEGFRAEGGEALRRHATFETIHAKLTRAGVAPWPDEYLDPRAPAVQAVARAHADDLAFAEYLQWQCVQQLGRAAAAAAARGMRVGLYRDLAVGSDSHGADAWCDPSLYARGVSIGAPPDDFCLQGQVWGLSPWLPGTLRARAYAPFAECLRANMCHAGALRIDHVLGLLRLFWVPSGGGAADGAYVRYPVDDLLAVTALESVRAGCAVVGEDLGTVPDGLREALAANGMLSYRVLYFEKHWHGDHSFRAPEHYPAQALVTVSTHDLATLAGFWTGHDLDLRERLGLFPSDDSARGQREGRRHDRGRLLDALAREGLRPAPPDTSPCELPAATLIPGVHRFLARTPAALLSVQMEDVLGEVEQTNVPGTVHEQPNWRRKLPLPVEAWAGHAPLARLAAALARERAGDRGAPLDADL